MLIFDVQWPRVHILTPQLRHFLKKQFDSTDLTDRLLRRYGTLEQNKIRDVVTENAQKNKRTSSESFSLRNKARRALFRNEKLLKKSFVFDVAFSVHFFCAFSVHFLYIFCTCPHHTKYW